jgi:hypothetical protein
MRDLLFYAGLLDERWIQTCLTLKIKSQIRIGTKNMMVANEECSCYNILRKHPTFKLKQDETTTNVNLFIHWQRSIRPGKC